MTAEINLFPTTVYKTNIQSNHILKGELLSKIMRDSYSWKEQTQWRTNRIITSFGDEEYNDQFFDVVSSETDLFVQYQNCFKQFFDHEFSAVIDLIWMNVYRDGEYQEQHNHITRYNTSPCHFSCVHYLSFDPLRHQPLTFVDHNLHAANAFHLEKENYRPVYSPHISEGDFIMFPTYLEHYVLPSVPTPDYPRITISMNISIKAYK